MIPAFPKPSQIKVAPVAFRTFAGDREVCNLTCKAGRDEYERRKRVMWERQGKTCCICGLKLRWAEAQFEHQEGRGFNGGHRDDRIWKLNVDTGKMEPYNGVAHPMCNSRKGSQRTAYIDAI
jgi:hypothetical protein